MPAWRGEHVDAPGDGRTVVDGLAPTSTIWAWPWASKWQVRSWWGLEGTGGVPICENGKLYLSLAHPAYAPINL